jgi:hypothetical protein
MSSPETLVMERLIEKLTVQGYFKSVKIAPSGLGSVTLQVVPSAILYLDSLWSPERIDANGSSPNGQHIYLTEMPRFVGMAVGATADEAQTGYNKLKEVISGHIPIISGRTVIVPMTPVRNAVPFQQGKVYIFGGHWQLIWKYVQPIST